jgi:hypothetical protein
MPCCAVLTPSSCATRRDWLGASSLAATLMRHRVSHDSWHDNMVCCQLYCSEVFHWRTVAKPSWAVPHMVSSSLVRDCEFVIARGSSIGTSTHNAVPGTSMGPYRCLFAVTLLAVAFAAVLLLSVLFQEHAFLVHFSFCSWHTVCAANCIHSFRNINDRCWRH